MVDKIMRIFLLFPNTPVLPLVVYQHAFSARGRDPATVVERLFQRNGWEPATSRQPP